MKTTMIEDSNHDRQSLEIDKETRADGSTLRETSPPRDAPEVAEKETSHATASPEIEEKPDEPPNGGYGWVCVACAFCINAHTWGLNSVCSGLRTNDGDLLISPSHTPFSSPIISRTMSIPAQHTSSLPLSVVSPSPKRCSSRP